MSVRHKKIFDYALDLPTDERLRLVEILLTSLNLPAQEEIDKLWAEEAEHRVTQLAEGEVEAIAGEQVFAALRKKYPR